MAIQAEPVLDEAKVGAFVGQVVQELGATLNSALVVLGDELLHDLADERADLRLVEDGLSLNGHGAPPVGDGVKLRPERGLRLRCPPGL